MNKLDIALEKIDKAQEHAFILKDASNNNLITDITQLKDSIKKQMTANSNNVFTFAKAWPLVYQGDRGAK